MEADEKRRVLVQRYRNQYQLLEGYWNMNTVVYTGSLENANNIKAAYLATGEYVDETK